MPGMMKNQNHRTPSTSETDAFATDVARHLQVIYKTTFSEGMVNRILVLCNQRYPERPAWNEKDAVLITYGNTLQEDQQPPLKTLSCFLKDKLSGLISCVHILPFFPFTSDDGFAVSNFTDVNPELGSWDDVTDLTPDFSLMADLVINHVSALHPWFKNYLAGCAPGMDYFIEAKPGANYDQVVRPRSTPLFTKVESSRGSREVWTTFSPDQIDLNFGNPEVLFEMIRILIFYISKGIRIIRLDAIAFLWKQAGTTCLHQPETHEIVKLLRKVASFVGPGTLILTETNVPNKENWSYFGNGDEAHMVYQFSLPPLILHALFSGNAQYLTNWACSIPMPASDQTYLNFTASHDGIGVRPLEGLLPAGEISALIEGMLGSGGLVSKRSNPDGSLSPYEMNITYFDAMKGTVNGTDPFQEARFLCSQAIMMSMQGIPAFYIHSLLATPNDYNLVNKTGRFRSINRSDLKYSKVIRDLSAENVHHRVFEEMIRLMGIRKVHPAFHPNSGQEILKAGDSFFALERFHPASGERIYCLANVREQSSMGQGFMPDNMRSMDLITGEEFSHASCIPFKAYQTRWIIGLSGENGNRQI
jgi:glycosidase